jgi:hypothetical protein
MTMNDTRYGQYGNTDRDNTTDTDTGDMGMDNDMTDTGE